MGEGIERRELMAGYERPYRRWLPMAWRLQYVHWVATAALAVTAGAAVLAAVNDQDGWLALALLAVLAALAWALQATLEAVLIIRRRTHEWRDRGDELADVRARRPHAGDADPRIAHVEYAVAVDGPALVTWRLRPLRATDVADGDERLVAGRPRYAARAVERRPFDAIDTARAAEQLDAAQREAAALEAGAVQRALERAVAVAGAEELAVEASSTGAALRRLTGQTRRR